MKPKISIVTLGVRDFPRALAFYRDGLGFEPHNYTEGEAHVMFRMEGSWLSLYPRHLLAEDATVPDDGKGFSGVTLAHNVKSRAEADAVFARAVSKGARPVKKPQDVFWGGYSGYFADPDGHLWEVAHNPFTDLT
jgi:catechol 2,3-dioxygenase-like lactoylglutathione lyase family enzyme